MTGLRTPLDSRPTPISWIDVLVTVASAIVQIGGTAIVVELGQPERPPDVIAYALLASSALSLLVRDLYPRAVLGLVAATASVYMLLGYPGGFYTVSLVFAVWAAVSAGHRLLSVAVIGILSAVIVVAGFLIPSGHVRDPEAAVWFGGWLVAAFVLGEVSRSRRGYLEQVERRAYEAERTREEEARRRAGEERLRIARELHDVLTHHISVINVQAGVAVHLLDKEAAVGSPDASTIQARQALATINASSREAMRELRGILGVLRQGDEAEPRRPTPGLDALDELVAGAGAAGLAVEVESEGERQPLPVGTDLAAYRIIQESLTNVARHAGADHARVSLQFHAGGPGRRGRRRRSRGAGGRAHRRRQRLGRDARARPRGRRLARGRAAGPRAASLVRARLPRQAAS